MPRLARLVPREGLTFPMPSGLDIPPEGVDVDADDLFWRRRLADGDVTEQPSPDATPADDAAPTTRRVK